MITIKVLQVIFTIIYCMVRLPFELFLKRSGPAVEEEEVDDRIPLEDYYIQEEIEALDTLVATLRAQEAALLERAERSTTDAYTKARLKAQASQIHLRIVKNSNKAIKLQEQLEKGE